MEYRIQNGPAIVRERRERIAASNLDTMRIDLEARQIAYEMELQHQQRLRDLDHQYGVPGETREPRVVGESSTTEKTRVDLRRLH